MNTFLLLCDVFSFVFWKKLKTPKKPFEITWPLGGTQNPHSFTETKYFFDFFVKILSYAYKTWGHDPIWYFSYLCRKFSELRVIVFLSSTQSSQNLKFIKKCPCLSSLKTKFQWTQKKFWPLIRKVLIWTFLDWKRVWSKKPTPIQPWGGIGAPPTL